ncbi:MAG: hypothetical protein ACRD8U_19075 [Pyrinomonadaceae bacterium]
MCLRLVQQANKLVHVAKLIVSGIVLLACSATSQGQQPTQSLRDMVRAEERKEMNRMLLLKPITAVKDEAGRRAVLKQISDDFRDMQSLNNKMLADAWAKPELDYRSISEAVSQIRSKAVRLKTNLALPELDGDKKKPADAEISNPKEFREKLLQLDRVIMSFATNPLFQKANVVELDLANKASLDLAGIIEQSGRLKETAVRFNKAPKPSQ